MRVVATQTGYYDLKRRRVGEVFDLVPIKGHAKNSIGILTPKVFTVEEQFSKKWMKKYNPNEELPASDEVKKHRGKRIEAHEDASL